MKKRRASHWVREGQLRKMRKTQDVPVLGSSLASLRLCTISVIDLIVPFLCFLGQRNAETKKSVTFGRDAHLKIPSDKELARHCCKSSRVDKYEEM